jgi:2'-5' RNA ligase
MPCSDGEQPGCGLKTLGWFALVSYIPDPLATFLDDLRRELTPGCRPKAHVTVLPPRPHHHDLEDTVRQITGACRNVRPFRVELCDMEIFEASQVVYLGLREGAKPLQDLYRTLNSGPLAYRECFPYHPHITIAQDLPGGGDAAAVAVMANEKWAGYKGACGFEVSSLSFVQHVAPAIWMDVAVVPLGTPLGWPGDSEKV